MTSKFTNILLILIVLLLAINILMTAGISKQIESVPEGFDGHISFDDQEAKRWGQQVVDLYNAQNHQAMYDLFHQQAKIKFSVQKLANQLAKLHNLFGNIEQIAFTNSTKLGEKNSEAYYQLLFNARVSQTARKQATMSLSMISSKDETLLYGFKLNALQSLD